MEWLINKIGRTQKGRQRKKGRRDWGLYILLFPGLLWFFIFSYKPMIGLIMSFYDWNIFKGLEGSTFVGLENFEIFIKSPDFFRVIKNTIMISVWQILICFPIPIILAILITELKDKHLAKLTQTITFLPYFVSVVVVCGLVISFTSPSTGIINIILKKFGIEPIYFMVKPQYFRGIYTTMTLWQHAGFNAIVYIAALAGIDTQLYEAASIDGANRYQKIIHITITGILPTIMTMFILNVGNMVKVGYEAILLLYKPPTYSTSDVIATYVYRLGIEQNNYGLATAVGLFEAVIALVMVVSANRLSKKFTEQAIW